MLISLQSDDREYLVLPTTTNLSVMRDIKVLLEREKSVIEKSKPEGNKKTETIRSSPARTLPPQRQPADLKQMLV